MFFFPLKQPPWLDGQPPGYLGSDPALLGSCMIASGETWENLWKIWEPTDFAGPSTVWGKNIQKYGKMVIYSGFSPKKMVIFHSYVKLLEGMGEKHPEVWENIWENHPQIDVPSGERANWQIPQMEVLVGHNSTIIELNGEFSSHGADYRRVWHQISTVPSGFVPRMAQRMPGSLGLARFDGMVTQQIENWSNSDVMGECGKPNINHAPKCGISQFIPI